MGSVHSPSFFATCASPAIYPPPRPRHDRTGNVVPGNRLRVRVPCPPLFLGSLNLRCTMICTTGELFPQL